LVRIDHYIEKQKFYGELSLEFDEVGLLPQEVY